MSRGRGWREIGDGEQGIDGWEYRKGGGMGARRERPSGMKEEMNKEIIPSAFAIRVGTVRSVAMFKNVESTRLLEVHLGTEPYTHTFSHTCTRAQCTTVARVISLSRQRNARLQNTALSVAFIVGGSVSRSPTSLV